MAEGKISLPILVFEETLHEVGYIAARFGLSMPVRINDTLWQLACRNDPAYDHAGLSLHDRISGIVAGFVLAAEEAQRTRRTEPDISFTLRLPILRSSLFSGRTVVRRSRIEIGAVLHGTEDEEFVCTLWTDEPVTKITQGMKSRIMALLRRD